MNNLYLFGDSFFDDLSETSYSWTKQIREKYQKKYNYRNFAKPGSGPNYLFYKLYQEIENIKEGDILVVHLSGSDRMEFTELSNENMIGHITSIGWNSELKKSYISITPDEAENNSISKKVLNYYNLFENEINFLFLSMSCELDNINHKNISFLYTLSKLKKIKILLFSNHFEGFHVDEKVYDIGIDYKNLNDNNFHISKYDLFDVAIREVKTKYLEQITNSTSTIYDKRTNHMSKENHDIMVQYIEKIINNNYTSLPNFKKNFREIDEIYEINGENEEDKTKFIYY